MESIFLAKLLGAYLLIYGLVLITRRKAVMTAIADMSKNAGLILALATIELAAGLAIAISYPYITFDWMGAISLIGWLMVVEGILYLAFSVKLMRTLVRKFNSPVWYVGGGAFSIALGAYLFSIGFALI